MTSAHLKSDIICCLRQFVLHLTGGRNDNKHWLYKPGWMPVLWKREIHWKRDHYTRSSGTRSPERACTFRHTCSSPSLISTRFSDTTHSEDAKEHTRVTDSGFAACISTHKTRSYLKSLPILLPLSGIPGSGHILCPWDTPTWVTTKQKQHIQRQNSTRNILSSIDLVDVERKMATGSSKTPNMVLFV